MGKRKEDRPVEKAVANHLPRWWWFAADFLYLLTHFSLARHHHRFFRSAGRE